MRLLIDSLVALMLVGILAGVALHYREQRMVEQQVSMTRAEVRRFQAQIMIQAAMEKVPLSQRGYPQTIDTHWFAGKLPTNLLLGPAYPWLEIAPESQRDLMHPPVRMATHRSIAQFWYNPYTGVVRARVPDSVSDATALRLYNQVNDSNLTRLY